MKRLIRLLKAFLKLNVDQIAIGIYQQDDVQNLIIELNTQNQLFDKGEDSIGATLESIGGPYSPVTIEGLPGPGGFLGKRERGLPFDRITLFDSGDFYGSFKVVPFLGGFRIEADTVKDGRDLKIDWGQNIIGLQNESKKILIELIRPKFKAEVIRRLLAA